MGNVVELKLPTQNLADFCKKSPEMHAFIKFVHKEGLREQAYQRVLKKIEDLKSFHAK